MVKKTHRLSAVRDPEVNIIGISSHENDYRVCWMINQHLGLGLNRTENLKIYKQKIDASQEFSLYQFLDEETALEYHLIANRCDNGFLVEELRNIDFFLRISGSAGDRLIQGTMTKLKGIDIITAVFIIPLGRLKGKDRLFF